jgi:hypothetical protein
MIAYAVMDDYHRGTGMSGFKFAAHPSNSVQALSQQFSSNNPNNHTLPPLNNASQFPPIYGQGTGGGSHAPISQYAAASSGSNSSIPPITSHPPLRPIQPSTYNVNSSGFSSAPQNAFAPTASHAGQAPIAPAPVANGMHDMRPSTQNNLSLPQLYPAQALPQHLLAPQMVSPSDQEPVHVVGQQGRRGVLPTVPGRPTPTAGKSAPMPTKNADNKFECPHCNKTYLHLKHLKRHLLRRKYPPCGNKTVLC